MSVVTNTSLYVSRRPTYLWRKNSQLILNYKVNIDDGFLNLMDTDGNPKDDVKVPDGDLGKQIQEDFDAGKDLMVTIIAAMGEEQVRLFCTIFSQLLLNRCFRPSLSRRPPPRADLFVGISSCQVSCDPWLIPFIFQFSASSHFGFGTRPLSLHPLSLHDAACNCSNHSSECTRVMKFLFVIVKIYCIWCT